MGRPNKIAQQYASKVEWANKQIESPSLIVDNTEITDSYCVLNDIGCGEFTADSFRIFKCEGKNAGYHAFINEKYNDPDLKSVILYLLTARKFGNKLKKYGIANFRVSLRGDTGDYRYMYCITAELNPGKWIKLSGDWVISWDFIAGLPKEKQPDAAMITHTVIGHPVWPCEKVGGRNTVNQARSDKISMRDTLLVLKRCYENSFDSESKNYEHDKDPYLSNLEDAFMDYKEWYQKFKSYEEYVEFWDIKRFETDITENNLKDIFTYGL